MGDNYGTINLHDASVHPIATNTLPREVTTFLGRDEQLRLILAAAGNERIIAIDGMPGIGKTALATTAARQLARNFPDGQFFVELNAHTPGQLSAKPFDVLARLLTDLGIDPRHIPDSVESRRDLWRDRASAKALLLVLDDAGDYAQIESLLPTGPRCMTLITSRRRLVTLDDVVSLSLGTLAPSAAVELFATLSRRREVTDSELADVSEIVRLCGHLPLAIVLLAGRLAHHPTWAISDLIRDFIITRGNLGDSDSQERTVHAAFAMSYADLSPSLQEFFRQLSTHPGQDVDAHAAAALADISFVMARENLDTLYTDHFLEETSVCRYRMHDLVRDYARTLAKRDPIEERSDSINRLFDYYQYTSRIADRHLARVTCPSRATSTSSGSFPTLTTYPEALSWMTAEQSNLLACLQHAAAVGDSIRLIELSCVLAGFLRLKGPRQQALELHGRAAAVARRVGDQLAEANALQDICDTQYLVGDNSAATESAQRALTIYREADNRLGQANSGCYLGLIYFARGDFTEAAEFIREALAIYQDVGDRVGEGNARLHLSAIQHRTGDCRVALEMYLSTLDFCSDVEDVVGQANALNDLGRVCHTLGDYSRSAEYCRQALDLYRAIESRLGEANTTVDLGRALCSESNHHDAATLLKRAIDVYREIGGRLGEANALLSLSSVLDANVDRAALVRQAYLIYREIGDQHGEAEARLQAAKFAAEAGEPRQALAEYAEALRLGGLVESPLLEAQAREGIAGCRLQLDDTTTARTELKAAMSLYQRVGIATPVVASLLASLDAADPLDG
ncbi:tetratricopeptide (TPR) repeat protein [Nocardia sp. GAS34]|uniref:ATP-binding protein n=1 Tax=unclassified Nocardia TaxID=2637762 RepID=UPI003D2307D7